MVSPLQFILGVHSTTLEQHILYLADHSDRVVRGPDVEARVTDVSPARLSLGFSQWVAAFWDQSQQWKRRVLKPAPRGIAKIRCNVESAMASWRTYRCHFLHLMHKPHLAKRWGKKY